MIVSLSAISIYNGFSRASGCVHESLRHAYQRPLTALSEATSTQCEAGFDLTGS